MKTVADGQSPRRHKRLCALYFRAHLRSDKDSEEVHASSRRGCFMRLPTFLFALCLATMVAFGAAVSSRRPRNVPQAIAPSREDLTSVQSNDDSSRMWRRAEIRVTPLEQAERNRAALQSLRNRVAQAERESTSLWLLDSNVRQQLSSQVQLMRELLCLAEQQQSERGKSPTALAVERRLNQLQGQTMCEACHSGIVARNHGVGTRTAR